jgi:hypothetical protein
MTLKEFKNHIESAENEKQFRYGISCPFSWRGSYDEVAFEIIEQPMSRDQILFKIEEAYSGTFEGYKGGEYTYNDNTEVHFEEDSRSWTDGFYCAVMISKIEGGDIYASQEMRLVNLAFS